MCLVLDKKWLDASTKDALARARHRDTVLAALAVKERAGGDEQVLATAVAGTFNRWTWIRIAFFSFRRCEQEGVNTSVKDEIFGCRAAPPE